MILTVCLAVLGMLGLKAQQSIIALHPRGECDDIRGCQDAGGNGCLGSRWQSSAVCLEDIKGDDEETAVI